MKKNILDMNIYGNFGKEGIVLFFSIVERVFCCAESISKIQNPKSSVWVGRTLVSTHKRHSLTSSDDAPKDRAVSVSMHNEFKFKFNQALFRGLILQSCGIPFGDQGIVSPWTNLGTTPC